MNEADTCHTYILPKLKSANWEDEYISEQMVLTPGRIVPIGDRHTRRDGLRPDYTLFIRQNIQSADLGEGECRVFMKTVISWKVNVLREPHKGVILQSVGGR